MKTERRQRAALLAALALFGLAIAPVLHAELHAREAEAEDAPHSHADAAAAERSPGDALELALVHTGARTSQTTTPQGQPQRPRSQGPGNAPHSHGPGNGPHGKGSLEHLLVALHATPSPPPLPRQPKVTGALLRPPGSAPALKCSLTPPRSQGPPLA